MFNRRPGAANKDMVGKVYSVWNKTYKGLCKCHPNCYLLVNVAWFAEPDDALRVVYEWLARGLDTTEQRHFEEQRAILAVHKPSKAK